MSGTVINWTPAKAQSLLEAYEDAKARGDVDFTWTEMDGNGFFAKKVADHPMHGPYVKRLLDYLTETFKLNPYQPKREYREGEEGQ